jgi:hypothetical protein
MLRPKVTMAIPNPSLGNPPMEKALPGTTQRRHTCPDLFPSVTMKGKIEVGVGLGAKFSCRFAWIVARAPACSVTGLVSALAAKSART